MALIGNGTWHSTAYDIPDVFKLLNRWAVGNHERDEGDLVMRHIFSDPAILFLPIASVLSRYLWHPLGCALIWITLFWHLFPQGATNPPRSRNKISPTSRSRWKTDTNNQLQSTASLQIFVTVFFKTNPHLTRTSYDEWFHDTRKGCFWTCPLIQCMDARADDGILQFNQSDPDSIEAVWNSRKCELGMAQSIGLRVFPVWNPISAKIRQSRHVFNWSLCFWYAMYPAIRRMTKRNVSKPTIIHKKSRKVLW
jgi:hypothetical protein